MELKRWGRTRANEWTFGGRLVGGSSALGMIVLLGLLILAPSASAGSGSHTFMAPYKTSKSVASDPNSSAGGGSGAQTQKAFWNKSAGIAGFSSTASATWWSNKTNSSANEVGQVVISIPIHIKTTGAHTITVVWTTIAAGYANLTAGTFVASSGYYSG